MTKTIITTHKNTDFDALASVLAASIVMHDLYGFCPVERQLTKGCQNISKVG